MRPIKRKRSQLVRIDYGPLVSPRNALRFGREGGCRVSTCELCLYRPICEGGTIGEEQEESENGEGNHDVQQLDEVRR